MTSRLTGYSRRSGKKYFQPRLKPLTCSCMLAMGLSTGTAMAQDDAVEEILVTGSRIERSGMNTPSPVTSVSAEELSNMAPGGIIQALNQLPQFYGNTSIEDSGGFFSTPGSGNLNLRGLGTNRTLVLLDGRRVASSTRFGGTDINLFPEALIRNVESVTGGASAAYGTDAVTGVTNFILDTDYTGFTAHAQIGTTSEGDGDNNEASFTFGRDIGDKGHVLFSYDTYEQDGIYTYAGRDWFQSWGTVNTPGGPAEVVQPWVASTQATFNGVISAPGSSLNRQEFNDGGTAISPFVECPGAGAGPAARHSAPPGSGCSGDFVGADKPTLSPDFERENMFVYADYDVTDNLNVFFQGIHGESLRRGTNVNGQFHFVFSPMQIYSGNAFLPASVQQTMDDEGIESFTLNKMGHSSGFGRDRWDDTDITLNSGTLGFEYEVDADGFWNAWQIDGYYQKGKSDTDSIQRGGIRADRVHMAHDAVVNPVSGQVSCNVTAVSGLYPDCVPLNPFGRGNATDAAYDWVLGFDPGQEVSVSPLYFTQTGYALGRSDNYVTEDAKVIRADIEQEVFEINLNGEIWEGWGAGPIMGAFGYGYREESMYQLVRSPALPDGNLDTGRPVPADDASLGIRGQSAGDVNNSVAIQYSKVPNIQGSMDVSEYYGELLVPLISDGSVIDQVNASLAARRADYSGSGGIWAWKWGVDAQINDQLRFRFTRSHDVRAGTLSERFDQTGGASSITDPFLNNESFNIFQTSGGDPLIRPEEADTITAGIIYQPAWMEGLSVSLDWYDVSLEDAISSLTVQQVIDQCFAGDETLCSRVVRNPDGTVNIISANVLNVAKANASGYDLEISYNTEVDFFDWGGAESFGVRVFSSFLAENSTQGFNSPVIDRAGQTQNFELPEKKITGSVNYRNGPFSGFFQVRWIDEGVRDALDVNLVGVDIDNNKIDSAIYADMNVRYEFELDQGYVEVFGNISNVFDEDPPVTPSYALFGATANQTNSGLFDLLGRRYTLGIRYNY